MVFAKPFFLYITVTLIALLLCGLLLSGNLHPDQRILLPLDDSYIHLQYGWQAAQGHFLQYNTGDHPSTGATSLLYMLLIALGFSLGVSRDAMPVVILSVGAVCFASSAVLITDAGRRLAERLGLPVTLVSVLSGLWFAGSGWMAWAFLSGMETGLLMLFISGALWAVLARRAVVAALCTALAALTRPEAALLGAAILCAEVIFADAWEPDRKRRLLFAGLPLLAVFISPIFNRLVAGGASATGFLAKSWFTVQPTYLDVIIRQLVGTWLELVVGLMGGLSADGRWHTFPLLQVWVVTGLLAARKDRLAWRSVCVAVLWAGGLLAATSTLQTATWHHYRYQMPAYPALVPVGVIGLVWLVARYIAPMLPRYPAGGYVLLLLVACVWSAYSALNFARAYTRDVYTIARMQVVLADWVRDHLSLDARIVVHDVGAIRFLGGRHTVDSVGLTTAGSVNAYRNGPGALYEFFAALRPDYYVGYPSVAPPYFGISTASALFGQELFAVYLPDYSPYVSAMDTQRVTRPDWSIADLTLLPQQPDIVARVAALSLVDALNIADLTDEQAHAYAWRNASRVPGFISDARYMTYCQAPLVALADGGRILDGELSFTVNTNPQQALLLVGRFHQMTDVELEVWIDDVAAGEWRLPALPGEWLESAFSIPAHLVSRNTCRVTLTVKSVEAVSRLSPFYFWVYQGDLAMGVAIPATRMSIDFGTVARLIGYDLTKTTFAPGDTLSLTLYWRALQPSPAHWHIFVHLMDPHNDTTSGIVAQRDAAPRAGTYPFWVWQLDEVVSDTLTLTLPLDVPPGEYALLLGIYNLDTGERASIDHVLDFGTDRLLLSRIRVH